MRLAGHLFRRAAFGATWEQLQQALLDGPQLTLDKLLRGTPETAEFHRIHDDYENRAAQAADGFGPQAWWLRRMCETPQPLLEQMTLFWHNHFALSKIHVANYSLLCRYLHALRQHAMGNLDVLLEAVLEQPALFIATDARANRKGAPNENVPRVLLEQFAMAGQVSSNELRDAARAMTGWFISNNELRYSAREHDESAKSFLGRAGDLDKKGFATALAQHRGTADCVVRKLYRWFISETVPPSDELIEPLVREFAATREIGQLVRTMLLSNIFFSPVAYGQKIKSPVEFAMSIIRPLNGAVATTRLASDLADLGQDLYAPPTIHGWAGHRRWINRFTLLGRSKLAQALFAASGPYASKLDPFRTVSRIGGEVSGSRFLFDLFLQGNTTVAHVEKAETAPPAKQRSAAEELRELAAGIVGLPEFNLA